MLFPIECKTVFGALQYLRAPRHVRDYVRRRMFGRAKVADPTERQTLESRGTVRGRREDGWEEGGGGRDVKQNAYNTIRGESAVAILPHHGRGED